MIEPVALVEKSEREVFAFTFDRFKEQDCVNVRLCTYGPRGSLVPSHAGFIAPLHLLPRLMAALATVQSEALHRGLVSPAPLSMSTPQALRGLESMGLQLAGGGAN